MIKIFIEHFGLFNRHGVSARRTGLGQLVLGFILFLACAMPLSAHANAFNDPGQRATSGAGGAVSEDFVPVTPVVDGGQVSIGSTTQVVMLFRNDSGHALTVGDIQLYPSSTVAADVTANQCSADALEASAVCAVSISIKGVLPGAWRVEMLVRHNGRAKLVTAAATGQVVAGEGSKGGFVSDIQAIPDKVDFGNVTSSQPVIRSVVLRNTTTNPIDITAVYVESADKSGYTVKTDCTHVVPGQACIAVVTWSPVLSGQASGVLVVDHSGPTKVASIDLDGKFAPTASAEAQTFPEAVPGKGLLVASQKEVDFGSSIQTTSAITVSLVNVGDAPLTLKDIRLANPDNGMSISKNGCTVGLVLEPVDACPLTLTWSPVREGAILDDVEITHDGTRGVLVLPVKGTATTAISQDSKAVRLAGAGTGTLDSSAGSIPQPGASASAGAAKAGDGGGEGTVLRRSGQSANSVDPETVLDGYTVTSHALTRAIIAGPGGSRIVFNKQQIVIGGFVWTVKVEPSGVEFTGNDEKVLLLFDTSLSANMHGSSNNSNSNGASTPGSSSSSPSASAPSTSAAKPVIK